MVQYFTRLPKIVRYSLIGLGTLVVLGGGIAGVAGVVFLRHSLPDYSGRIALPGVSSEVKVFRDAYGVPHIFASTLNDAARALGYAHASDRMFQMEMQRRAGQGRLSEVAGADTLGIDRFIRTLGLYNLAKSSATTFAPETLAYFQAYADGVNAWLTTHQHALPPEFTLLHINPEPWTVTDSVVWGKLMALQLSHNYKLEVTRALLGKSLSPAMMAALFPVMPVPSPITMVPHSAMPLPAHDKKVEQPEHTPSKAATSVAASSSTPGVEESPWQSLGGLIGLDHGASNEWAIAGSRTDTGKPILANDPHLGLEAPILWYLARIVTPDLWFKGATVPGVPIVLLGQNDHIAWGFTTTNSDTQDLFIETIDPKDAKAYRTPQGSQEFITRQEIIHVKGGRDELLQVRSTRHGPVLSDIDPELAAVAGEGKVISLAFTGLAEKDKTSEALMMINRARNWQEFKRALQDYQAPTQNLAYADSEGHIGYINPGLVPVRKKGEGESPVDGASGDYDWVGTVPFSQLPQLYDPKAGFVFNANNEVTNLGITPYVMSHDWDEPYRARRLQQFFDTIEKHSLASSLQMQADTYSTVAEELLPYLLRETPATEQERQAFEWLKSWDKHMQADSAGALIFEAWLYELHQKITVAKAGAASGEKGPYAATSLAIILNENNKEWCGAEGCSVVVKKAFADALAMLTQRHGQDMTAWHWGEEHVTILRHKIFSHVPLLSWWSDLSVQSDGGFYVLNRGESFDVDPDHPFVRHHGGGFRGVYDLGNPDQSLFMIATGESGHIASSHYGDLVPLWNKVKGITLSGSRDELQAKGYPLLSFVPSEDPAR